MAFISNKGRPVGRAGQVAQGRISSDVISDRLRDVPKFESSMHAKAYKLNAYDVRIEDTRRAPRVSLLLRSFPRFFAQTPLFIAPAISRAFSALFCVDAGRSASGTMQRGAEGMAEDETTASGQEG